MDLSLLSATELAAELGARIRRERLRQNLTQRTLAERAGVSRPTIARVEATGTATLTNFLEILIALRRTGDLDGILEPPPALSIDAFTAGHEPVRKRGRR